jgi:hypothetical protein
MPEQNFMVTVFCFENESAFGKCQRWRLALLTNKMHVRSSK